MQIGIFDTFKPPFYEQMHELSKEIGFTLTPVGSIDDAALERIDGLITADGFSSSEDIANILKRFKNILLLDQVKAASILTPEMAIICEEADVELMVAGPDYHKELFNFISRNTSSPYYVRVVKESSQTENIRFDTLYHLLYWNAFFSEGEIRKFKINSMPAVDSQGILIYGRSESAINIPVDVWFSNLAFDDKDIIRIFSQTEVLDLDCRTNTFKAKNKEYVTVENFSDQGDSTKEVYIRSFLSQLKNEEKKQLNVPLPKFLKLVEFYNAILQKVNL